MKNWLYIALPLTVGLLMLLVMQWKNSGNGQILDYAGSTGDPAQGITRKEIATLYFADPTMSKWHTEQRTITEFPVDLTEKCRTLVDELTTTSHEDRLAVVPKSLTVASALLSSSGVLYIDLLRSSIPKGWTGPTRELFILGAVVQTLLTNIEGATAVKILIDGEDSLTLMGSVFLMQPLYSMQFANIN